MNIIDRKIEERPLNRNSKIKLEEKTLKDSFRELQKNVSSVKSLIDQKPPRIVAHLSKQSKDQLLKKRVKEIQNENVKIKRYITNTQSKPSQLDNWNKVVWKQSSRSEKRKQEQMKIFKENAIIWKRLQLTRPNYSHHEWETDWLRHEILSIKLGKYLHTWKSKTFFLFQKELEAANSRKIGSRVSSICGNCDVVMVEKD